MSASIAIVDARAPKKAIRNLEKHFEVFTFLSHNITYDAIAGHPDVFMFQGKEHLIIAPNAPADFLRFLEKKGIPFVMGDTLIGDNLRNTTAYNCIETETHLFHKKGFTDSKIIELVKKPFIELPQAYTRCSMIALNNQAFITSDKGIEARLIESGFDCLCVNPENIVLPPYKHGFIGGCLGIIENNLFVIGSLDLLPDADRIRSFIEKRTIEPVELCDGGLYDGGGLFFV